MFLDKTVFNFHKCYHAQIVFKFNVDSKPVGLIFVIYKTNSKEFTAFLRK